MALLIDKPLVIMLLISAILLVGLLVNLVLYTTRTGTRIVLPLYHFIVACSSVVVILKLLFIIRLVQISARWAAIAKKYDIEEAVLGRGPQVFKYKALCRATKDFNRTEFLGRGAFGSVFRGSLALSKGRNPTLIAVKRISATSTQGVQEFLAEVRVIAQTQHRNLVKLLGWCHERRDLMLVYEYMPNGSVHDHLYTKSPGHDQLESVLTWARRLKILSGVATALAYLHEEWEQRVIHRDVKSSNVMLDGDFNARLGDFGLARLSQHDQATKSTEVLAGTYGYLAPELPQTLKPTEKTDVYSFGALVLEVAAGKRPLLRKEDRPGSFDGSFLVDWVWDLYKDDALLKAADCTLHNGYDPGEMVMVLKIGLLCSHPNPDERPNMREVINIWKGSSPIPLLPREKPVPIFPLNSTTGSALDTDENSGLEFWTGSTEPEHDQKDHVSGAESFLGDCVVTVSLEHEADSPTVDGHEGQESSGGIETLRKRPQTTRGLPL